MRLHRVPPKSDFETWAAYASRVNREPRLYYALPFLCGGRFAYDAEAGRMSFDLDLASGPDDLYDAVNVFCSVRRAGSFVGQNAFGVRRQVAVRTRVEFSVSAASGSIRRYPSPGWGISAAAAASVMPFLVAYLVVHPSAGGGTGLVWDNERETTATMDDPTEERVSIHGISADEVWLWVVHGGTGRVLYQEKLLERTDAPAMAGASDPDRSLSSYVVESATPRAPAEPGAHVAPPSLRGTPQELADMVERIYPAVQRDSHVEGEVELRVTVTQQGDVEPGGIEVVSASAPVFADAARRVVESTRFVPMSVNDSEVASVARVRVRFVIPGGH